MAQSAPSNRQAGPIIQLRIIWFALVMSHFMYAIVLWMRISQRQNMAPESFDLGASFRMTLILSAFALLVTSLMLPKLIFSAQLKKLQPLDRDKILKAYIPVFVIFLALSEAISLLGFVQGMSVLDMKPYFMFAAVGVGNMIINFPDEKKILTLANFR